MHREVLISSVAINYISISPTNIWAMPGSAYALMKAGDICINVHTGRWWSYPKYVPFNHKWKEQYRPLPKFYKMLLLIHNIPFNHDNYN